MTSAAFTTRFAPSPTGYLHKGHAFSALTAFGAARAAGGRFVLRIEDIDSTRVRPEYDAALLEDLHWLGLSWEEPVRRQSGRLADYRAALDRLRAAGLAYRCFRTRKDVGVAYHLAVTVDDALQGITHVIRGQDLFQACHIQRLLQALLGLPEPLYRHHPLLLSPAGQRLAKRDRAESLREIRARGVSAAELRAELGF